MNNEESFDKFFYNRFLHEMGFATEKESVKFVWDSAIAYMQEQNKSAEKCEPVASISAVYLATGMTPNIDWLCKSIKPYVGMTLFTSPQPRKTDEEDN